MTLSFDKTSDTKSQKSINYSSSNVIIEMIKEKKPKSEIKIGMNITETKSNISSDSPPIKPGVL